MISQMNRKVLVTGASGALGQAVVRKYVESGYSVYGACHENIEQQIALVPEAKWILVDLTQPESVKKAFHGLSFDVLIHCVGGFRFALTDQISDSDLNFLLDTNLKSAFLVVRELLPQMKKNNFGRIVFISAKSSLNPPAGMSAYAASKAGINALTLALAEEVKSFDLTVNSILPTIIDTPTNRKDMPQAKFETWVTPNELAEMILSLTSKGGRAVHGALIPVAGRV
jgi:NAD(P)-dependent dehydrogenase (short-subunit alcohol dehydrogenase family)